MISSRLPHILCRGLRPALSALLIAAGASTPKLVAQNLSATDATRYPELDGISFRQLQQSGSAITDGTFAESLDGKQIAVAIAGIDEKHNSITAFSTADGSQLWSHVGKYSTLLTYNDAGLMLYDYSHIQQLDPATGLDVWRKKPSFWKGFKVPIHVNGHILASTANGGNGQFIGLDLATGERTWTARISHGYGVPNICDIDSIHSFIVADDLYKIDWTTGATEKMKIDIGNVSGKRILAQIGLGLTVGMIPYAQLSWQGNTLMPVMTSWEVVTGRVSNILAHDGLYYMADQDCVRCFDANLEVRWEVAMQRKRATQSRLSITGDTLVMVNLSTAFKGGCEPQKSGRPFVAAFRLADGQPLCTLELSDHPNRVMSSFTRGGSSVLVYDDSCQVVTLAGGPAVRSYAWDEKAHGKLVMAAPDGIYHLDASEHRFRLLAADDFFVLNDSAALYRLPKDALRAERYASSALIYVPQATLDDGRLVILGGAANSDCWIIHPDGTPYCHFDSGVGEVEDLCRHIAVKMTDGRVLLVDKGE